MLKTIGIILILLGIAFLIYTILSGIRNNIKGAKEEYDRIYTAGYVSEHVAAPVTNSPFSDMHEMEAKAAPRKRALSKEGLDLLEKVESQRAQEREDMLRAVPSVPDFELPDNATSALSDSSTEALKGGIPESSASGTDVIASGTETLSSGTDTLLDKAGPSVSGTDTLLQGTDILAGGTETLFGETGTMPAEKREPAAKAPGEGTGVLLPSSGTDVLVPVSNQEKEDTDVLSGTGILEEAASNDPGTDLL